MTWTEIPLWFLVIFASDIVAQILWGYIEKRKKSKFSRIQCMSCNQVRRTRNVNGQQLCAKCRKLLKATNLNKEGI